MHKVRKFRRNHTESIVWKRLLGIYGNAMIGENRVRDHLNISFRHVAADTVVGRSAPLTHTQRNRAAVVGKPRREFRWIHNRVSGILWRKVRPNCRQVSRARPVTVLATNSQFEERWLSKFSVSL